MVSILIYLPLCVGADGSLTIFRLPPGLLAVRLEGGDDILYAVIDGVVDGVVRPSGVTVETFLLVLQEDRRRSEERVQGSMRNTGRNNSHTCADLEMADNAVRLFPPHPTCG